MATVLALGGGEVTARQQQFACNFIILIAADSLRSDDMLIVAGEGVVGDAGVEEMRVNVHS